jgi:hypothetical protein
MQFFCRTSHALPGEQSSLVPQLVLHVPSAAHRYGAHASTVPAAFVDVRPSSEHVAVLGTHFPPLQRYVATHFVSSTQLASQAVPSAAQTKPSQLAVMSSGHFPFPSQSACAVRTPAVQLAGRQVTAEPVNAAHPVVVLPSHVAAAHVSPPPSAHAVRVPCGLPFTGMHLPGRPVVESGTSQASHCPLHAVSQQTASTHSPLPHSAPAVHPPPFTLTHVPSLPGNAHVAPVPHAAVPQQKPSVHASVPHAVGPVQGLPSASLGTQRPPLQ